MFLKVLVTPGTSAVIIQHCLIRILKENCVPCFAVVQCLEASASSLTLCYAVLLHDDLMYELYILTCDSHPGGTGSMPSIASLLHHRLVGRRKRPMDIY